MKKKTIRILLSPFIFAYTVAGIIGMCIVPVVPCLMIISLGGLIINPILKLIRAGGTDVDLICAIIPVTHNVALDNLLQLTAPFWVPFLLTKNYIQTGDIAMNF